MNQAHDTLADTGWMSESISSEVGERVGGQMILKTEIRFEVPQWKFKPINT